MVSIHIVIDIDNTILDGTTTHLKYCNLVSGRNIHKDNIKEFTIYKYYNWTEADFLKVYEQYGIQMHEESLPLPYAIETIKKLKQEHKITFMTARPEQYREVTEAWLKKYDVPYDQLIMTEGKLDRFIKEHGDILIDDSPYYAKQFKQNNLPMIIMSYPYNSHITGTLLYHALNWMDIEQIVSQFKPKEVIIK